MSKNTILLIGNGFNLVSDGGTSWNDLLNSLAGTPKTKHESDLREAKPFTLWFEEIASGTEHSQLKQRIAEDLKMRLAPNRHHKDLMALNFQHILTTNYDYNLEAADGGSWIPNFPAPPCANMT
jgi:hypothetical protein